MQIHQLCSLVLTGKKVHVNAKPEPFYAGLGFNSSQLQVVEVSVSDLEKIFGNDFEPNTVAEDSREAIIAQFHQYAMPLADCPQGASKISWHGDTHCLRALLGSSIRCQTVAFVATANAVACLQRTLNESS